MLTRRGGAVLAAGATLWIGARLTGSGDLHIVAAGVTLLPLIAWGLTRWSRQRLKVVRRLSRRRVFAGSPVRVELEVHNPGGTATSMVLLEDRLPPALGRAARAVLDGLRPRTRRSVSYTMACDRRGRYRIGPVVASLTDPFGLARHRISFEDRHELLVYPEVEDLTPATRGRSAGGAGETASRRLHRAGEEFYTMRPYVVGDDLRRIHWRSTARTGELMIRQDETGQRSSTTLFLDTRDGAYASEEAFELAISVAASLGSLQLQGGVALRLAGVDLPPRPVTADGFLETLALVRRSRQRSLAPSVRALRERSATGSALVLVTHVLDAEELRGMLSATAAYGSKLAVIVDPLADRPDEETVRRARLLLAREGWQTLLLAPGRRLREVWTPTRATPAAAHS